MIYVKGRSDEDMLIFLLKVLNDGAGLSNRYSSRAGLFKKVGKMTEYPYDGAEGRPLLDLVIKHMVVVDCDGTYIGAVDKVEGGHLKIVRPDQAPSSQHGYVSPNWIAAVDDRVRLNVSIDEAKRLWATEPYAKRHHIHRSK